MTAFLSHASTATMFIILVGTPGSGKDTIARYLETKHGFSRVGTEASTGAVSCRDNPVVQIVSWANLNARLAVESHQQQALPFPVSQLPSRLRHPKLAIELCHDEHNERARSFTVYQEAVCFGCRCGWAVNESVAAEPEQVSRQERSVIERC